MDRYCRTQIVWKEKGEAATLAVVKEKQNSKYESQDTCATCTGVQRGKEESMEGTQGTARSKKNRGWWRAHRHCFALGILMFKFYK